MNIFGYDIRIYFLLFMIYSIMGWMMEVTCKLIQYKRFINRGFLIGPYCPIYGYGALLITFLLKNYTNDPIILFFMAIIICGTLEYLTSFFMEKIFKARWWDYSKRKFNINGRVCLGTIVPFGLLGILIMYFLNPFFLGKIEKLPELWLNILFWTLLAIYLIDNVISGIVVRSVKVTEKGVSKDLDNTEEITKKVREILMKKSVLHRRLMKAYPKAQAIKIKIKEKKDQIIKQGEELKENITEKGNQMKENLTEKSNQVKEDLTEKSNQVKESLTEKSNQVIENLSEKGNKLKENLSKKNLENKSEQYEDKSKKGKKW